MRRIAVVGLAVILALFPALAMSCGGDGDGGGPKSPEGQMIWTETQEFACTFSPDRAEEEAYEVTVGGELKNRSEDTVEVWAVIIRLYNRDGGVVADEIDDRAWAPEFTPTMHYDWSFTRYYAQEVVRYDVLVTDSTGKKYVCIKGS